MWAPHTLHLGHQKDTICWLINRHGFLYKLLGSWCLSGCSHIPLHTYLRSHPEWGSVTRMNHIWANYPFWNPCAATCVRLATVDTYHLLSAGLVPGDWIIMVSPWGHWPVGAGAWVGGLLRTLWMVSTRAGRYVQKTQSESTDWLDSIFSEGKRIAMGDGTLG